MQDLLGTVLPTPATIRAANATDPRLRNCDRRVVRGEVRYYDTTDQYAIVSRDGEVLWFQVHRKGDYPINY